MHLLTMSLSNPKLPPSTASIKEMAWKPNGMDIDTLLIDPTLAAKILTESSELKQMDEEPESIDPGDLDIFSLE